MCIPAVEKHQFPLVCLSLCSSPGVFPHSEGFPMHFAIHIYPSGVTCSLLAVRLAISAAQKWVVTLQGQTLGDIHPGSCWIALLPVASGPITVVIPQAMASSWWLKGSGCPKPCPRCPCPHPPAAAVERAPVSRNGFSVSPLFNLSNPFNVQHLGSEGGILFAVCFSEKSMSLSSLILFLITIS